MHNPWATTVIGPPLISTDQKAHDVLASGGSKCTVPRQKTPQKTPLRFVFLGQMAADDGDDRIASIGWDKVLPVFYSEIDYEYTTNNYGRKLLTPSEFVPIQRTAPCLNNVTAVFAARRTLVL